MNEGLFSFFIFHQSCNLGMMASNSFSIISFMILFLISVFRLIVFATEESPLYSICGSETTDGDYKTDLTSLLDSLSSKASTNTFYNDTFNQIYALYLCRGDVNATSCQSCVETAVGRVIQDCQYNQTGIIWYDRCMLRYSNENFFGKMETVPRILMWNVENQTYPDDPAVGTEYLLSLLMNSVPSSKSLYDRFKTPSKRNKSLDLYGLAQCTRDINKDLCRSCLSQLKSSLQECCEMKVGYRYLSPSCNMRYEKYLFYDEGCSADSLAPAESPPPVNPEGKGGQTTKIVIVTVSTVIVVLLMGSRLYYAHIRRKTDQPGVYY